FRPVGPSAGLTNKAAWLRLKPLFLGRGWTVVDETPTQPYSATLHLKRPGTEAWAFISISQPGAFDLDIVEAAAGAAPLVLKAPATRPELVGVKSAEIPYLSPMPGSKRHSAVASGPMTVTPAGSSEATLVATQSITFNYDLDGLSNLAFLQAYHGALVRAGWKIVNESPNYNAADAVITAHYGAGGRDIWAYLHSNIGSYSITVGDAGAKDLAGEFASACHAALLGVVFEFNKASLKPESLPVLERAVATLRGSSAPHVEVQGHTDAVGGEAYNQALSETRARSVSAWLSAHGIAPARLSARGYGKSRPIADNRTDAGRARNRRVEIANLDCRAK
ncbi:MAG TPA: OmpA family protein, partial [Caulobacteraceae bacterium]